MIEYMKRHEQYVLSMLETGPKREELAVLLAFHDKQIAWMQQERLAHLITMMFVCLFFLLAFGFTIIYFILPCVLLTALLLLLAIAYIIHYYRLENSVQRWYGISNRIQSNLANLK